MGYTDDKIVGLSISQWLPCPLTIWNLLFGMAILLNLLLLYFLYILAKLDMVPAKSCIGFNNVKNKLTHKKGNIKMYKIAHVLMPAIGFKSEPS